MGQIFPWGAICEKKVPAIESFTNVKQKLIEALTAEPSIVCGLLFGSVIRGDFNIRSDVDCVVIYEKEQQKKALAALHRVGRVAFALHVPIEYTTCDTTVAKTHLHHFGPAFVRHLQSAIEDGGLVKGGFAGLLAPSVSEKIEIESYVRNKMGSLGDAFSDSVAFSDERMAAFLKKAFEAPMHIARKVLIYEETIRGDSKKDVQMRYRETVSQRLSKLFDYLIAVDAWYTKELVKHLEGPDKTAYTILLRTLEGEIVNVLEFLRLNIARFNGAR